MFTTCPKTTIFLDSVPVSHMPAHGTKLASKLYFSVDARQKCNWFVCNIKKDNLGIFEAGS